MQASTQILATAKTHSLVETRGEDRRCSGMAEILKNLRSPQFSLRKFILRREIWRLFSLREKQSWFLSNACFWKKWLRKCIYHCETIFQHAGKSRKFRRAIQCRAHCLRLRVPIRSEYRVNPYGTLALPPPLSGLFQGVQQGFWEKEQIFLPTPLFFS